MVHGKLNYLHFVVVQGSPVYWHHNRCQAPTVFLKSNLSLYISLYSIQCEMNSSCQNKVCNKEKKCYGYKQLCTNALLAIYFHLLVSVGKWSLNFASCCLHRWLPTRVTWREKLGESALDFYKRLESIVPLLLSSNSDSLCSFISVTEFIHFFPLYSSS